MTEHNWLSTFHFVLKMQGKTKLLYSSKAVPFSEPSILFEDAIADDIKCWLKQTGLAEVTWQHKNCGRVARLQGEAFERTI